MHCGPKKRQSLNQFFGTASDQTSLLRGWACPPAIQMRVLEYKAECSWRAFQTTFDRSCCHSLPSREYHTSPQFFAGLLDHPPRPHSRSRYTTAENQSRGSHGARRHPLHFTPSDEHQTSFTA